MKLLCLILSLLIASIAAVTPCYGAYCDDLPELTEEDLMLISKAVHAEAAGKSYLVKVCITSMIFNRIKDSLLPDTAYETVMQNGAFLKATPEAISEDVAEGELEEYVILTDLVYKYGIDPTCGALFCIESTDPDKYSFDATIETDGLIFAKPANTAALRRIRSLPLSCSLS